MPFFVGAKFPPYKTIQYKGTGRIKGGPETDPDSGVFVLSTPAIKRVFLFHRRTWTLIIEMYSAADGSFEFSYLTNDEYFCLSWDETGTYNDVIAGPVRPFFEQTIVTGPIAGQVETITLETYETLQWAKPVDSNEVPLDESLFTVDEANKTVTFSNPLDLTGYTGPYKIFYSYK